MVHRIDTSFGPPFHFFGSDQLRKFNRTFFGDEKIIVVKLECVRSELIFQKLKVVVDRLCRFTFPSCFEDRHNSTERAAEWATDARMIGGCLGAQESFSQE